MPSWRRVALATLSLLILATPAAADGFEQSVLAQLNAARTHPQDYARPLQAYRYNYKGKLVYEGRGAWLSTQEGVAAVDEAITFLERQPALPPLLSSAALTAAAVDQVRNQGLAGLVGHDGPDGSDPESRISRHGHWTGAWAENVIYIDTDPASIVRELIIDDGVPDRGHRTNIFDPTLHLVGIACGPHKEYGVMCVMDFATSIEPLP